jgi:F-box and WD-40 domain protein CDC4
VHHRTLYVPFVSPPTPTPSPGPSRTSFNNTLQNQNGTLVHVNSEINLDSDDIARTSLREFAALNTLGPAARRRYLALLLAACTPTELLFISTALAPMLTRDFLAELPLEIALHVLGFVDDHQTLLSAGRVSRQWRKLCGEELVWKGLVEGYGYDGEVEKARMVAEDLQEPCLLYRTGFQYCQTSGTSSSTSSSYLPLY